MPRARQARLLEKTAEFLGPDAGVTETLPVFRGPPQLAVAIVVGAGAALGTSVAGFAVTVIGCAVVAGLLALVRRPAVLAASSTQVWLVGLSRWSANRPTGVLGSEPRGSGALSAALVELGMRSSTTIAGARWRRADKIV